MAFGLILGGIIVLPTLIPLGAFTLYGLEMSHESEKRQKNELNQLIQSDQNSIKLIGTDSNKNGIRDSIEDYLNPNLTNDLFQLALPYRFAYAYQQSIDIKSVPEFKRAAIYHDIDMVEACGDTVTKYLDSLTYDNFTTDPVIRAFISDSFNVRKQFETTEYLNKHKTQIFLNNDNRIKAKRDSDAFVGSQYTSNGLDRNLSIQAKAEACFNFADKAKWNYIADQDTSNTLLGVDVNGDGIRDNINAFNESLKYSNAVIFVEQFSKAYLSSMNIQNVPKDQRKDVYTQLEWAKTCIQPIISSHEKSNIKSAERIQSLGNPSSEAKTLQLNVDLSVKWNMVKTLVDHADEVFLNTEYRYQGKRLSDKYASNNIQIEPIFPVDISEEDKEFKCRVKYQ